MQNAADLGGIISMWRLRMYDYVRKFHKKWKISKKYVTFWYQFLTRCE